MANMEKGFTDNAAKEHMRTMNFLDQFRNDDYPDDIAVIIYAEGLRPEQVQMRCVDVTEEMMYGTLLNEPNQDYGVHAGDRVGFIPVNQEEGLMLVAPIEKQCKRSFMEDKLRRMKANPGDELVEKSCAICE